MIEQSSIDKVLEAADVVDVIARMGVDLKKKGVNYTACCPFHDEKTSSFVVSPVKNIYKCFGCGRSGGALQFMMDYGGKTFPEAIEELAAQYSIAVEHNTVAKKPEEIKKEQQAADIIKLAQDIFITGRQKPEFKTYASTRGWSEDLILNWGLGFNDDYRSITGKTLPNGTFEIARACGLVTSKVDKNGDNKNYDVIVNRITFPIYDNKGLLCGFGGRYVGTDDKFAKYINPKDSPLYNKSNILYGLDRAHSFINKTKTIILVEGYVDVISLHEAGCSNAVASCGTSLTVNQVERMSKMADNIIVMYDNDSAGIKATAKACALLLQQGKTIKVMDCGQTADGKPKDADDYAIMFEPKVNGDTGEVESIWDNINSKSEDAIWWATRKFYKAADPANINALDIALTEVCFLITKLSEFKRQAYIKALAKEIKVGEGVIKDKCKDLDKNSPKTDDTTKELREGIKLLPKGVDEEEYITHGCSSLIDKKNPENTGYYFMSGNGGYTKVSNFVIKPLYHVYGEDNYRMIQIDNGRHSANLMLDSKDMVSVDAFEKVVFDEGNYIFEKGTKMHLQKINVMMGEKFPLCWMLDQLGWQNEGFFAFSNYIYNGEVQPYNELGIVSHADKYYLSPAIASRNGNSRKNDDKYENDRYLELNDGANINFETWMELFSKVYPEHAIPGIGFALVTLFKDVVQKSTKVPLLYAYGKIESGKSEFAESLTYLFFSGKDGKGQLMKPFNLNQGTEYAFFNLLERYTNVPVALNEFDENSIDEARFRAIKGIYDGEGRQKGSGIKNKTKTQKINCTVILMGQFLSTKDDNSVLSRGIPCSFKQRSYTEEDTKNHKLLKTAEQAGLSKIIPEMLKYRKEIAEFYSKQYDVCLMDLKSHFTALGKKVSNRMTANCTALYTMLTLADKYWTLPFKMSDAKVLFTNLIDQLNDVMQVSDSLGEFWSFTEYMLERGEVIYKRDLKVEAHTNVTLYGKDGDFVKEFGKVKQLLFIRVAMVHRSFEKSFKMARGKSAPNFSTIKKYLEESEAYIGSINKTDFYDEQNNRKRTNAMVFDYEKINAALQVDAPEPKAPIRITVTGLWVDETKVESKVGVEYMVNRLRVDGEAAGDYKLYKCHITNMDAKIFKGETCTLTGDLKEGEFKGNEGKMVKYYHIYVTKIGTVEELPF
jgi:DNA primase catalytic core